MTSVATDRRNSVNSSKAVKVPCRVATTAAITLSGEQTIDGVAVVDGDRVLVKDQASGVDNGIYVADTSTWERALDFDGSNDVVEGTLVKVNGGTLGAGFWYVSTTGTITPGSTIITFAQASTVLAVVSAFVQTLLDDTTAAAFMTTLGITSFAQTLLDDVSAAAARSTLGVASGTADALPAQGRLSLTTAVAVTTSDVSGATTVYFTPYRGNTVTLYDGSSWTPSTFTELSQATTDNTKSPAAVANNSNYDVFVWSDSGTLRATRGPAWTSDTGRGTGAGTTELELFEGRLVNKIAITNGPAARRGLYVGTIRSDGSAQINDTAAKRHVWNMFNRVPRQMRVIEATNTWAYSTATTRQANNSVANQLDFVVGQLEDEVRAEILAHAATDSGAQGVSVGVGVDSTTVFSGLIGRESLAGASVINQIQASYNGYPGLGRHFLAWLERGAGADTQTWSGDAGGTVLQSGIHGSVMG